MLCIYIYLTGDKPDIYREKIYDVYVCPMCFLFLRIFTSLNISGAEPVDDSMLVRNTQSGHPCWMRNVALGFLCFETNPKHALEIDGNPTKFTIHLGLGFTSMTPCYEYQ